MALEVWTVSSMLPGTELIVLLPTARTLQHVHQKGASELLIFTLFPYIMAIGQGGVQFGL